MKNLPCCGYFCRSHLAVPSHTVRNTSCFSYTHRVLPSLLEKATVFPVAEFYKQLSVHPSVVSDSLWPLDYSPPGSSVHGILQARILEWIAMLSSRGSSQPRNQTRVSGISCIAYSYSIKRSYLSLNIFFFKTFVFELLVFNKTVSF